MRQKLEKIIALVDAGTILEEKYVAEWNELVHLEVPVEEKDLAKAVNDSQKIISYKLLQYYCKNSKYKEAFNLYQKKVKDLNSELKKFDEFLKNESVDKITFKLMKLFQLVRQSLNADAILKSLSADGISAISIGFLHQFCDDAVITLKLMDVLYYLAFFNDETALEVAKALSISANLLRDKLNKYTFLVDNFHKRGLYQWAEEIISDFFNNKDIAPQDKIQITNKFLTILFTESNLKSTHLLVTFLRYASQIPDFDVNKVKIGYHGNPLDCARKSGNFVVVLSLLKYGIKQTPENKQLGGSSQMDEKESEIKEYLSLYEKTAGLQWTKGLQENYLSLARKNNLGALALLSAKYQKFQPLAGDFFSDPEDYTRKRLICAALGKMIAINKYGDERVIPDLKEINKKEKYIPLVTLLNAAINFFKPHAAKNHINTNPQLLLLWSLAEIKRQYLKEKDKDNLDNINIVLDVFKKVFKLDQVNEIHNQWIAVRNMSTVNDFVKNPLRSNSAEYKADDVPTQAVKLR